MWTNYFFNIQRKYSMRVSKKLPLVIRLDGKDVTKNKSIDLMDRTNEGFGYALEETVKYFTSKYHCYAIFGSDEVSFICVEPTIVLQDLDSDATNYSNEIISVFSQYFFKYFNEFNKHRTIYWHGKCFTISNDKIKSYVKYRSKIIENVMATYFLKSKKAYSGNEKLSNQINKCMKYQDYKMLEEIKNGILYFDGNRINLEKFYEDKIEEENKIDIDDLFSDLL